MERKVIWSSINPPGPEPWMREEYPYMDESELQQFAMDDNNDALDDLRITLKKRVGTIVVVADLGLWNRVVHGAYKVLNGTRLSDCLWMDRDIDFVEWFLKDGEFRATGVHHDGTNTYEYRVISDDADIDDIDDIRHGTATTEQLIRATKPLGDEVAKALGW